MNLKMNMSRTLAVVLCGVLSQSAMSAVITTSASVALFDSGSVLVSVTGLDQFDASLGTLTGITFNVDISLYEAGLSLGYYDGIGDGTFQYADLMGQISISIPTGQGGGYLFASEVFGGPIFDELDAVATGPLPSSQSEDATSRLQDSGLFNDFIGTGTLGSVELGIFTFFEGARVYLDDGSGLVEVLASPNLDYFSVGPSTVSIDYTYVSAVPVPAAVWLFGSGLIGLAGLARSKK